MGISRRGFLAALVSAAPAIALAKTKIWLPDTDIVTPEARLVHEMAAPGQMVRGYVASVEEMHGALHVYADDVIGTTAPIIFLGATGRTNRINRFVWYGSRPMLVEHSKMPVIAAFENEHALRAWLK